VWNTIRCSTRVGYILTREYLKKGKIAKNNTLAFYLIPQYEFSFSVLGYPNIRRQGKELTRSVEFVLYSGRFHFCSQKLEKGET
jgi:hypothetical protein